MPGILEETKEMQWIEREARIRGARCNIRYREIAMTRPARLRGFRVIFARVLGALPYTPKLGHRGNFTETKSHTASIFSPEDERCLWKIFPEKGVARYIRRKEKEQKVIRVARLR